MPHTIIARGGDRPTPDTTPGVPKNPVEYLAGAILWLPPKPKVLCMWSSSDTLPEGCYDHPVAILSKQPGQDGVVIALTITSFDGKSLKEARPDIRVRAGYLPIVPSEPHPENGSLLHLKDTRKHLRKKSYINAASPRIVPPAVLRHYDNYSVWARTRDYVLSDESYDALFVHYSGLQPPTPAPAPLDTRGVSHHPPKIAPVPFYKATQSLAPLYSPDWPALSKTAGLRIVGAQAREAPSTSVTPTSLNGHGSSMPPLSGAWRTRWEQRNQRVPQSLSVEPGLGWTHENVLSVLRLIGKVMLAMVVLLMAASIIYSVGFGLYQIVVWVVAACKAVEHFGEACWDMAKEWIEALLDLFGRI